MTIVFLLLLIPIFTKAMEVNPSEEMQSALQEWDNDDELKVEFYEKFKFKNDALFTLFKNYKEKNIGLVFEKLPNKNCKRHTELKIITLFPSSNQNENYFDNIYEVYKLCEEAEITSKQMQKLFDKSIEKIVFKKKFYSHYLIEAQEKCCKGSLCPTGNSIIDRYKWCSNHREKMGLNYKLLIQKIKKIKLKKDKQKKCALCLCGVNIEKPFFSCINCGGQIHIACEPKKLTNCPTCRYSFVQKSTNQNSEPVRNLTQEEQLARVLIITSLIITLESIE